LFKSLDVIDYDFIRKMLAFFYCDFFTAGVVSLILNLF
jgi:hypothetical protein